MGQYFQKLQTEVQSIRSYTPLNGRDAYFVQEVLRFYSIAGTIEQSFKNVGTSVDERVISHILIRSVIENYFKLLWIFDNPKLSSSRFDECLNEFKVQYAKLYNDQWLPHKIQLKPSDPSWPKLKKAMDLNSMLTAIMNTHGNRLSYIYFVYRIASFDTHGNSLEALFNASFRKNPCNFPVLNIEEVTELIANEYLVIWNGGNIP